MQDEPMEAIDRGEERRTGPQGDNSRMADEVTRGELDAKLELLETRMAQRVDKMVEGVERIERDLGATRDEYKSTRTMIISTCIGTGIAVVAGIAAFNATVLGNMMSSFEAGKNTATAVMMASEQLKATQAQLADIQAQLATISRQQSKGGK